jgi:uncharacterized membrane protein
MDIAITLLLWFAALSAGLMAGIYYAFSGFGMRALAELERPGGMLAMRAVNRVILRSAFLPLFLASSAVCAVLAVYGVVQTAEPGGLAMAAGGALYVVGMPVVTMLANVPLNNALEAADPASAQGSATWDRYLVRWTLWNHVRVLSCLGALGLFMLAVAQRW